MYRLVNSNNFSDDNNNNNNSDKTTVIRRSNMARVTTRAPYNVRYSYSAKQLVSEVGT